MTKVRKLGKGLGITLPPTYMAPIAMFAGGGYSNLPNESLGENGVSPSIPWLERWDRKPPG